jgi:hypothetical protein
MKHKLLKIILTKIGALLSKGFFHQLNGVFNYLFIGWWFKDRGFKVPFTAEDRPELYKHVVSQAQEPLTYLEFGVFKGASMRIWSSELKHENTRLFGFDSFEGLPETWRSAADLDTFNVKGATPDIEDSRLEFVKGWFDQSLPEFLKSNQPTGNLVVHFDADLYSSTKVIIEHLGQFFVPGTLFVFDELFDRDHELKALEELLESGKVEVECIGATKGLTQAAFRVL